MNSYEIVLAFNIKENQYTTGLEAVRAVMKKRNITVDSEKDMGDRELAYPVKKEERAHYQLINFKAEPDVIIKLDADIKLVKEVLKYLIVKKED